MAKTSNATAIGNTESNLHNSVDGSEVFIEVYSAIWRDGKRKSGGVCDNNKGYFSKGTKNVFIELLMPKAKPVTVGIINKYQNKSKFL